jgi:hypothetical protein
MAVVDMAAEVEILRHLEWPARRKSAKGFMRDLLYYGCFASGSADQGNWSVDRGSRLCRAGHFSFPPLGVGPFSLMAS